jgi:hypothetical protein
LHEWAQSNLQDRLTTKELADIFEIAERTVRRTLAAGPQQPGPLGRHRALDEKSEQTLVSLILDSYAIRHSLTPKESLQMVRGKYDLKLTKGWVNAFIGQHLDSLQVCRSWQQEDNRLIIPRAILEAHIENIRSTVAGKCSELVFNLDEVGSLEWEDRK